MSEWLASQLPDMLAQLRAWVEIETPSAEPARVAALAAEVARPFEALGARATLHPAALQLDLAQESGSKPASPLLLLGHLDTVYPVGTLADMPFRVEGERACGPGAFDMKAGVVQALFALRALRHAGRPLPRPIRLLLVFDEETGSPYSRPLTESLARAAAAALVLEPAADGDGKLKIARKGIARYRLAAHGRAAHAGLDPAQGANAIVALASLLPDIAALIDFERGLTVNVGLIAGGTTSNVVPAEASAEIDARAWTAADLESLDRRLRTRVEEGSVDPRVTFELTGGVNRPPLETTPAIAALFARAQAIARDLGFDLASTRVGGGSDGNFTAALGTPTLDGLGPVGAGAHSPSEHILVDHLPLRAAFLARLLACEEPVLP